MQASGALPARQTHACAFVLPLPPLACRAAPQVGTLDELVSLSDDLQKIDSYVYSYVGDASADGACEPCATAARSALQPAHHHRHPPSLLSVALKLSHTMADLLDNNAVGSVPFRVFPSPHVTARKRLTHSLPSTPTGQS